MEQDGGAQACLNAVWQDQQPGHCMVIGDPGPLDPDAAALAARAAPPVHVDAATAGARLDAEGRQDLVLVGRLDALPRREGEVLLARLRDLYARRVLVTVALGGEWHRSDLTGFGFTWLGTSPDAGLDLYGFDVASYQTVPDWLNSRFWANPDLWGKYRW